MAVFLTTLVLFLTALGLHLIVWKIRLPKFQTRTLLLLFALVLSLWLLTLIVWPMPLPAVVHVCLFYISLSLSYVITYSAFEADSPTLSLIRHAHEAADQGMSFEEVRLFLEKRPFVKARLAALTHDGLVREENGRYFAIGGGSIFFRVILLFRKLYGPIQEGG
ncbi:MAG: hypothetical protein QOD12_2499 [Verrucomicrobiota bacterium]|jgi:hypothetical protein